MKRLLRGHYLSLSLYSRVKRLRDLKKIYFIAFMVFMKSAHARVKKQKKNLVKLTQMHFKRCFGLMHCSAEDTLSGDIGDKIK